MWNIRSAFQPSYTDPEQTVTSCFLWSSRDFPTIPWGWGKNISLATSITHYSMPIWTDKRKDKCSSSRTAQKDPSPENWRSWTKNTHCHHLFSVALRNTQIQVIYKQHNLIWFLVLEAKKSKRRHWHLLDWSPPLWKQRAHEQGIKGSRQGTLISLCMITSPLPRQGP